MKMNKAILFTLILGLMGAAQADVLNDFKALERNRKGPFTVNYLQHTRGRTSLGDTATDGCVKAGGSGGRFQFQAAFRNALAQRLAAQDFYVGNLFTTNYYQLTGEYVFGDPCSSHEDDPRGLQSQSVKAMPKAASMARHWVLEKHYVAHFQSSALSRGFKLRGISDSANEAQYALLFFNFYLNAMTSEVQFLPAYLLVKESPVGQSSSIDKARDLVANSYDFFRDRFCGVGVGCSDPRVTRLYQLRNAVHNQLSQDVIGQIDQYLKDFPFYKAEGHTYLQKVQQILRDYYSFSPKKISEQAQKGGFTDVKNIADAITRDGATVQSLRALSAAGAALRANLNSVPADKKTDALITLAVVSQFVNKEVNTMKSIVSKDVIQIILDAIYMEGFLIKDNWFYFSKEVKAAKDISAAAAQLPDFVEIAQATLDQAFNPALKQWVAVESKMQSFVDNTIKASSLNTASLVAEKLKR